MARQFLSAAAYRHLARQGSPALAAAVDAGFAGGVATAESGAEQSGGALVPSGVKTTNQTGAFGTLTEINATAGSLIITAPNPVGNAGKSFGGKLTATASSHTMSFAAHASETFDGTTPPSTSTAEAEYVWTSDGANWLLTEKV